MVPGEKTIKTAIEELKGAVEALSSAVDGRFDRELSTQEFKDEVHRVHADRAKLAHDLDQAEFRANRLEEVNREVSRRLVTAMETIRAVLDR